VLVAGIVLLIIGVAIVLLTAGRVEQLGYIVAVIGVLAIVLALLLGLVDGSEGEGELDADALAPLLTASLLKARLR
jgi:hypothetical protein